ncbi:Ger(x)C family spore germination protein [Heliophilum fasciatum]|nr:Ger(x)C family spore germination protein [Heliophilum fasciatum]MCW2279339.1 Ger(x)C family germination protein [Heliophilum fasciatum]
MKSTGPRRRRFFLLSLGCLAFLLTGCWDRHELEQLAFVVTMVVDRSVGNQIDLSMRIAVPSGLQASGDRGTSKQGIAQTSQMITVTARSLPEAIALAEATVERALDFRHLRVVAFGEPLAREGLLPYLDTLERYRQFRRTIYIWVAKEGSGRRLFLENAPVLEKNSSAFIDDLARTATRIGYSRMPTLHEFLNETDHPHCDSVIALIGIAPLVESERKNQGQPVPTEKYHQQLPPHPEPGGTTLAPLARSGGNPVEFLGVGLFQKGKMIDQWSGQETRLYNLLKDTYRIGLWNFDSPTAPGPISLQIRRVRPIKIGLTGSEKFPHMDIALSLEGEFVSLQSLEQYVSTERISAVESFVTAVLQEELLALIHKAQKAKADPFDLVRYLQRRMLTMQEFDALPWRERFAQATVTVSVDFKIRRTGLRIQPRLQK